MREVQDIRIRLAQVAGPFHFGRTSPPLLVVSRPVHRTPCTRPAHSWRSRPRAPPGQPPRVRSAPGRRAASTPCVRPRAAGPASRRVRRSAPIRASTARPWHTSFCAARRPATREAECRSPSTRCGTSVQEGRCLAPRPCRACHLPKSASPCATARIRRRSGRQSGRSGRRGRGRRRGIINPSSGPTRAPRRRICGGGAYE